MNEHQPDKELYCPPLVERLLTIKTLMERERDILASLFFFFLIPGYNRASYVIFMFSGVTIYNFAVSQTAAFASHSFIFFFYQTAFLWCNASAAPHTCEWYIFHPFGRLPFFLRLIPDRKSLHLCKHVSHTLAGKEKVGLWNVTLSLKNL